jgi:hypothetical protein
MYSPSERASAICMKVSHSAAAGWPNLVMSSPSRELLGANVHIGPFDTSIKRARVESCNTKSQIEKQPSSCAPAVGMVITERQTHVGESAEEINF